MTTESEELKAIRKLSRALGDTFERLEKKIDFILNDTREIPNSMCFAEEYCKNVCNAKDIKADDSLDSAR